MRARFLHRLGLAIMWVLGALALAHYFAQPSMEKNALLFGQSLGKLAAGSLCALLLLALALLSIFYDQAIAVAGRILRRVSQYRWGPALVRVAWILCVTILVLISLVAIGVNLGAPFLKVSRSALEVALLRTRFLVLWLDLVLLTAVPLALVMSRDPRRSIPASSEVVSASGSHHRISWQDCALVAMLALAVVAAVWRYAWVSEDSFITFRYVTNALEGYGPVFNVGERVQGYTHPLWFMLLVVGTFIFEDPILVSIALGLIFTFLAIAALGYAISGLVNTRTSLVLILGLSCITLVLSGPWLSFQTGGLENSLANLLISLMLMCIWANPPQGPEWIVALASLLCLNRPDFAILVAPVMLVLMGRMKTPRTLFKVALAAFPAMAWVLFAWVFYGNVVPNTAYAKLGIYPNWVGAVRQGLLYIGDWYTYDRVAAMSTTVALAIGLFGAKTKERVASVIGVALYAGWVIWIGGDFMRGRLMTPVFTAAIVLAALTLSESRASNRSVATPVEIGTAAICGLVALIVWSKTPNPGTVISAAGIVNERSYYPGYSLASIRENGVPQNPYLDTAFALELRRYGDECGEVTIHSMHPGTNGYLAGPKISVIDTLGLTDGYIARLPREFLVSSHPRPGHPKKEIPITYLMSRKDIALLPNWKDGVRRGDCSLIAQLSSYMPPAGMYRPP